MKVSSTINARYSVLLGDLDTASTRSGFWGRESHTISTWWEVLNGCKRTVLIDRTGLILPTNDEGRQGDNVAPKKK